MSVHIGLAAALAVTPAATKPPEPCHTKRCTERVARKACSNHRPVPCIQRAALHYRVSFSMLKRKAWCESRFKADATNGEHVGVFQFAWGTWGTTPYAQHSPWFAKWSSLAAAYMHAVGRGREWECV
jgi:hypothetical protein